MNAEKSQLPLSASWSTGKLAVAFTGLSNDVTAHPKAGAGWCLPDMDSGCSPKLGNHLAESVDEEGTKVAWTTEGSRAWG
jgi:hypothetical protein